MCVAAVRLPLVIADLGGRLLPRRHAWPDRDRAHDRLEVEETEAAPKRLQLTRQRWLDDEAVLDHRLELALLGEVELLLGRQVGDRRDAALQVGHGLLRADAGEVPDVVRAVGPAAADERALARLEALGPDRDVGKGPREHITLARDLVGDRR